MMLRSIALAAIAATTFSAQAALQTYAPWDAGFPGIAGVQFNVNTGSGITVAMGAHAYKNGVLLPNNGVDTYNAQSGIYVPDGLGRANWSFDFAVDKGAGSCVGCTVHLLVDKDPTAGTNFVDIFNMLNGGVDVPLASGMNSWNMEMAFMTALVYDFNPFGPSSTAFQLFVTDNAGARLVESDILVNVPEPASLALAGLALAALAGTRRRKV